MLELEQLLNRPDVIWVFLTVVLTLFANYFARRGLLQAEKQTSRTKTVWDDAVLRSARQPLAGLIWVIGISFAAEIIAADTNSTLSQLIDPVRFVAVVFLLAYFLYRFISEAESAFISDGADVTTANAVGKLLRTIPGTCLS